MLLFYPPVNIFVQMKNVMYANKCFIHVFQWGKDTLSTVVRSIIPWGKQLIVPCEV